MSHRCFFETSIPDFISLSQLCKTLCDHMEYSTPGFPVHHQTPQFAQTRVYLIDDAIQPSHSLLFPLLAPFNLSEHQDLFQEVNSLHPVAKVSRFQVQHQFSSVQSLSRVRPFVTPWIAACQASLSITNPQSLLKLMPIKSVMHSSHLILCRPLLLLPPIPPSIRVFSNESTLCMRWPKCWSFSFSVSPSNEHAGLISFRMDWLDLLAVQGTLKSLSDTTVEKHQFVGAQLSSQSNSHIHTRPVEKA